jgi:ankyrin repeat protein
MDFHPCYRDLALQTNKLWVSRTLAYWIHHWELTYSKVADFPAICRALDLTEDDRFSTPIIDAVRGIDGTSLDIALDMNPRSVNDRDATGRTALHWAAQRGDEDAVRVLLSYKADPSAKDLSGYTPLQFAAECHNSSSIMQILLAAGSDPNARCHYGCTPLVYAVGRVATDDVVALLQAGSKADASNDDGENAFHMAARGLTGYTSNTEEDLLRIFQSLIEYGGDPNKTDRKGRRPLDFAIMENNILVFRALCRLGVEVDHQNKDGWTILHYAATRARSEIWAALLEMEISTIDPHQASSRGWTPTDLFQERLDLPLSELPPGQSRPTEEETALFEQLVTEMRERYHGLVYSDSEERELSECSDSEEEEWLDAEETP